MLCLYNKLVREMTERGILKKLVPKRPVLSVGNISFGGTGKTPHVMHIAKYLIDKGKRVCVLTRGYKRKSTGFQFFGKEEIPDSVDVTGDEPFLLKQKIPGVILCVGENRHESMERVLNKEEVDLFLLDDGFQQFQIAKSFDAVLLRYNDLPNLGKMANQFLMRESPSSLRHADFIVITKAPAAIDEASADMCCSRYCEKVERAYTRYRVSHVSSNAGSAAGGPGGEFFLFGGVGDFSGLLDTARDHGISVGGYQSFPDHVEYSDKIIDEIRRQSLGRPLLTTEKDIVKLPYERFGEIYSISIEVEFLKGKELFERKILDAAEAV
jgi:tetraacyldisaccharide 4'-kinase